VLGVGLDREQSVSEEFFELCLKKTDQLGVGRVWLWGGGGEAKVVGGECKMLIDEIVVVVGVIVGEGVVVHVSAVVREAVRKLTAVTTSNYS
jgi:hypothetical protein